MLAAGASSGRVVMMSCRSPSILTFVSLVSCSENVPLIIPMCESRGLFDGDIDPERFELTDVPAHGAVGMPPLEIVGADFVVGDPVAHDVVRDFENLMAHGNDRFLVAAMPLDAVIPGLQRRVFRVT